jgi:hypothetical protein
MDMDLNSSVPPLSATGPTEAGKGGEGGDFQLTNAEFVAAVFQHLPEGAFAAVCSKGGDPNLDGWRASRADLVANSLSAVTNNYLGCSSFYPGDDGSFRARKAQFAACHFLMLDDLGTKVPLDRLKGFELSWLIETSPCNFQGGIILAEPIIERDVAVRLLNAVISAGLCDPGASGPLSRWARLPVAINGKPKYIGAEGAPFQCRLHEWRPSARYTPEEIVGRLQLELAPAGRPKKTAKPEQPQNAAEPAASSAGPQHGSSDEDEEEVFKSRAEENPVVTALKDRGLYKTPLGSGKHGITCPWLHEHTDEIDSGTAYFEPDDEYPLGGFKCHHSHGHKFHLRELLVFLGIEISAARNKDVIRIYAGELHRIVDAAEKALANRGRHFQAGGLIVAVSSDPTTSNPSIVPTTSSALTRELSIAVDWLTYNKKSESWLRCDPPQRHLNVLFDGQCLPHLPPLRGVARQPYFCQSDGKLVTQPGYDRSEQLFAVFNPRQFVLPPPTPEAARAALDLLEGLLAEFHFVSATDKAAALAAILTAVVRPTLPHAPAFHVRAPVIGSGKSYLCEVIGAFAGPGFNCKTSYPTSSEEATKVILALLLTSPAVIEFDDMVTDWIPHGVINRMLTAEEITDRILGVSKTATVSTRTLFLGSGNNVGPLRDLLRRVATIHLNPRSATPATMSYTGNPLDEVRKRRGVYVSAALTIIEAWRAAGAPRAAVDNIASFGGAWSDYCRHPLIWLGHPDPATALLEQVRHDPDGDALGALMAAWHAAFGPAPTTIRKAMDAAPQHPDLLDAMRELPVEDKGEVNRSKLGWFLKKIANRIVGGYEFQRAEADGRPAWRVVAV